MSKKNKILVNISYNVKDGNCAKENPVYLNYRQYKEQKGIERIAA
jgi:hypothetical protein